MNLLRSISDFSQVMKFVLRAHISLLIDILNLERVVIGSIFQRSESLLRPAMELVLQEETLPLSLARCKIVTAELGDSIGDIAALSVSLLD